jgi:hypothetical protein
MNPVCLICGRVNPPGAVYCYHDGTCLLGSTEGPLDTGAQPFQSPFVFPSGRSSRSFDELVLAAEACWDEAVEALRDGFLTTFLGGLGRLDLARLARQATNGPDLDRALHELLERMPASSRRPPQLFVQPREIDLGIVSRSETRPLLVRLENQGMGLVLGDIGSEDAPWLVVGEPPGTPRKVFEFRQELLIPVHVLGERMRAGAKPLLGMLVVESNGGAFTIPVRASVPAEPFPDGILAGAVSPRQLAEKARTAAKEAAGHFESGAVKSWYEANGWTYPVQGTQAGGLGGVQQFFEALGLTTPPKIELAEQEIRLAGKPGERLEHSLRLASPELRPVYASARSEAPWIVIDRISGEGRKKKIKLVVPEVPDTPGETLRGEVQIEANGNQRFTVAVTLAVAGTPAQRRTPFPQPARMVLAVSGSPPELSGVVEILDASPVAEMILSPGASVDSSFDFSTDQAIPFGEILDPTPVPHLRAPHDPEQEPPREEKQTPPGRRVFRNWLHAIPLGLVVLTVLGAVLHDILLPERDLTRPPEGPPTLKVLDPEPYIASRVPPPGARFGLLVTRDLGSGEPAGPRRLTFDPAGRTNNTCIRLNRKEVLFGGAEGNWVTPARPTPASDEGIPKLDGVESVWTLHDLSVRQVVEIIPNSQSRLFDTCLVRYTLENRGEVPVQAGLRVLLDTHVGGRDGVPFTVPGQLSLCDNHLSFNFPGLVPDYLEALENDSLKNPGTVARLHLRLGPALESPSRVQLGGWPDPNLAKMGEPESLGALTLWEVPRIPMRHLRDKLEELVRMGRVKPEALAKATPNSAVTLTWEEKPLERGEKRELGFAYGLGPVHGDGSGKLLVSVGGQFLPGGEITVTTLVANPAPGDRATLTVPAGFEYLTGSKSEQQVLGVPARAQRRISPVTWRLRAAKEGTFSATVRLGTGETVTFPILIYPLKKDGGPGLFEQSRVRADRAAGSG